MPLTGLWPGWRLELFFKSQAELRDTVIPMLRSHGVQRVNITNKSKDDTLLPAVALLRQQLPSLDVCVHYSLKFNSQPRDAPGTLATLSRFCAGLAGLDGDGGKAASRAGANVRHAAPHTPPAEAGVEEAVLGAGAEATRAAGGSGDCDGDVGGDGDGDGNGRLSCLLVSGSKRTKSRVDTLAALRMLREEQQQQEEGGQRSGGKGVHPPPPRATATSRRPGLAPLPPLYVAFNPYLPLAGGQQEEERRRLAEKLLGSRRGSSGGGSGSGGGGGAAGGVGGDRGTGAVPVVGVYLQMGTDLGALEDALDYLDSLQAAESGDGRQGDGHGDTAQQPKEKKKRKRLVAGAASGVDGGKGTKSRASVESLGSSGALASSQQQRRQQRLQVYGSVFLPTKRLLAQMRFRPWNGVFLSDEYLGGLEGAQRVTRQLLRMYRRRGVVPLVESPLKTEAEARELQALLRCGWEEDADQGAEEGRGE